MDRTGSGQKSLGAIARERATRGFLNERGKPYAPLRADCVDLVERQLTLAVFAVGRSRR
jgi:hypothetical protein